jgi:monoamine oxidase
MVQSFKGPISVTRDSSVDSRGQFSLTCFLVGDLGRSLSQESRAERHHAVTSHIKRLFSPFVDAPKSLAIAEHGWTLDQWAQGCPCPATLPGVMSVWGHALRITHGSVHFVGWRRGISGRGIWRVRLSRGRGAEEIIRSLRKGIEEKLKLKEEKAKKCKHRYATDKKRAMGVWHKGLSEPDRW